MTLNGYDWDHVLRDGEITPEPPFVVISGRTIQQYDDGLKKMAQEVPVYIRGGGDIGNHRMAAIFKSEIIIWAGVTTFYEDNDEEIAIIRRQVPSRICSVVKV